MNIVTCFPTFYSKN